jgi:O-antigen/teichoic acid export membrane protein
MSKHLEINKILQSKFISRTKIIFLGSLVSQVITFGTSFIITAYFTPEDLGLLGTLTALISIVAGTLSFRFELAIIQETKEDAPNTFFQATILSGIVSFIFCIICLFLPFDFAKKISSYFIAFVVWVWSYIIYFNSKQLPFKFDELNLASLGAISRSIFTFFFQLISGLINPTFSLLLSGRILGDYVGSIFHWKNYLKLIDFKKSTSGWMAFLKKHKDFILYMTPHHLCVALSQNIIIFFLEKSYGLAIVGFYTLGQRLIQAPIEIIGASLFNVTTQRFGELQKYPKELKLFYSKVVIFSLVVSSCVGLTIFGSIDYFIPILGNKWLPAAPMVKSLIPYFMNIIFITPTINFLRFINKSMLQLIIEVIEVVIKIGFLSLIIFKDSNDLVFKFSLFSLGLGFLKTILVFRLI